MELIENYEELKARQLELENLIDSMHKKIALLQDKKFRNVDELSKANGKVRGLLEDIYIYDDMAARRELHELNAYIQEIRQFRQHADEIIRVLSDKINYHKRQLDSLDPQVKYIEDRARHWKRQYDVAINKLNRASFATFPRCRDRLIEVAKSKYINDLETAKKLIEEKERELTGE